MSKNQKNKKKNNIMHGFEEFDPILDLNDQSLEAELLELIGGGESSSKKSSRNQKEVKPIAIDSDLLNLDINDMKEEEIDENDPELLAELNSFLIEEDKFDKNQVPKNADTSPSSETVKKLENLKNNYQEAINQAVDDLSKARRYERSLNLINDLLQKALHGQPVNESEFPPNVAIKPSNQVSAPILPPKVKIHEVNNRLRPTPDASFSEPPNKSPKILIPQKETDSVQKSQESAHNNTVLDALLKRQDEYKHAALEAKSKKDLELAKGLMFVLKLFDGVIESVKKGEPFDLDEMPPPPSEFKLSDLDPHEEPVPDVIQVQEKPKISSLGEELKLRQKFYQDSMTSAKSEGNDSKARRLGRLVQQYDEALDAFKKNQPYSYEELPPPPGREKLSSSTKANVSTQPLAQSKIIPKQPPMSKITKVLLERQAQFKSAALKAKQDGDLPLAKELLKQSKGIDQMIQASESGFPVNLSTLPSLPTDNDNFELIHYDECEIPGEMLNVDKNTLFKQLQITLLEQIKTCQKYGNDVSKSGDIISARRFESLAKNCEKDLNGLKCLIQKNAEIPKFHYEYKVFSIVQSNPDLGETEMSVDVVKGTDFAIPSGYTAEQLDTYIVLELPFPNDAFQTFTTETVKRTNNPIYNSQFKFQVNLKSRVFQRVTKSKQLKADIYYKKGIFQKDKLLGTSMIKLEKLESQCTIHELFNIHENRKLIGGKLEVKIRIRMPLSGSQSDTIKEKWLIIDDFNQKNVDLSTGSKSLIANKDLIRASGSIEVLKYEIGELKRKLNSAQGQINSVQINSIKQKIQEKELVVKMQEDKLKSSDPSGRLSYLQSISNLPQEFNNEAKKFLSENNRDKAQVSVTKKRLVEKEIERLKDLRNKLQ